MPVFIAADPAQVFAGGAMLWGPGYRTPDAAASHMALLATTRAVPLILVEAEDFESAVHKVRAWPTAPPA